MEENEIHMKYTFLFLNLFTINAPISFHLEIPISR